MSTLEVSEEKELAQMCFENTLELSVKVSFSPNDLLSSKPVSEFEHWAQYLLSEVSKGPGIDSDTK
jgi:hypothetical protein